MKILQKVDKLLDTLVEFLIQEVIICNYCKQKMRSSCRYWKYNNYYVNTYDENGPKNISWLATEKYNKHSDFICGRCCDKMGISKPCF